MDKKHLPIQETWALACGRSQHAAEEQLSLHTTPSEPALWSLWAATAEAHMLFSPAPYQEKVESSLCSPQLEKTCA